VPVEADCVAHPARENLQAFSIRGHAHDGGKALVFRITGVAGCPYRHVELAIGTEANELPTVMLLMRETAVYQHRLGWAIKVVLDVIETYHPMDFGYVKCSIPKRHPVWHVESLGKSDDFRTGTPGIPYRIDFPFVTGADKNGSLGPEGEGTGARDISGKNLDCEARGKLDLG
jgi:hypothetical protein